jgi:hypothetical protein
MYDESPELTAEITYHGPAHLGEKQPPYKFTHEVRVLECLRRLCYLDGGSFAPKTVARRGSEGPGTRLSQHSCIYSSLGRAYGTYVRTVVRYVTLVHYMSFGIIRPSADRVCLALCHVVYVAAMYACTYVAAARIIVQHAIRQWSTSASLSHLRLTENWTCTRRARATRHTCHLATVWQRVHTVCMHIVRVRRSFRWDGTYVRPSVDRVCLA